MPDLPAMCWTEHALQLSWLLLVALFGLMNQLLYSLKVDLQGLPWKLTPQSLVPRFNVMLEGVAMPIFGNHLSTSMYTCSAKGVDEWVIGLLIASLFLFRLLR